MKVKIFSTVFIILLGFLFVSALKANASGSYSKSWASANDWQDWTGIGVDITYSNDSSGLILASLPTGHKTSGTISYHFSTSGLNSWNEIQLVSQNVAGSNQISFKISDSPISASNPGVSDPKQLAPSSDLYFALYFTGDGTQTPILKSMTLIYDNNQVFPKIFVEKKIFQFSTDGNTVAKDTSATFEPFNKIMVQVKVVTEGGSDADIELTDRILDGTTGIEGLTSASGASNKALCNLQATDKIINSATFGDQNVTDNALHVSSLKALSNSTAYLCYSYRVSDIKKAKNELSSLRVKIEESLPDGSLSLAATSNYYALVKGFALLNSNDPTGQLDANRTFVIDDLLSYSFVNILMSQNGQSDFLGTAINYIYKRGIAGKSRGGDLYSLPVQMTNSYVDQKDKVLLAADSSYILYNPVFYLFGNIFSGDYSASQSLDMGSRSTSITRDQFNSSNKNNSDTSLYNYNFDPNSVVYWDKNNPIKNQKMTDNINALLGPKDSNGNYQHPSGVCDLSSSNSLKNDLIDLNNNDCLGFNSPAISSNPKGTAWYYKVKSGEKEITVGKANDSDQATRITGNGTLIVDFADQQSSDAKVILQKIVFDQSAAMGLIIINGGSVVFGPLCEQFNGIVFASGS